MKGFSHVCAPLFRLTEKGAKFVWSDECDLAFKKLKQALTSSPILAYPDREATFILDTDASNFAYGAVLSQGKEGDQERVTVRPCQSLRDNIALREKNF